MYVCVGKWRNGRARPERNWHHGSGTSQEDPQCCTFSTKGLCESKMLCRGLSHAYNHFMPLTVLFCKISIILIISVVCQPVVYLYWVWSSLLVLNSAGESIRLWRQHVPRCMAGRPGSSGIPAELPVQRISHARMCEEPVGAGDCQCENVMHSNIYSIDFFVVVCFISSIIWSIYIVGFHFIFKNWITWLWIIRLRAGYLCCLIDVV